MPRGGSLALFLRRASWRGATVSEAPPAAASDEEIIRRVQRGERELFTVIFDRHHRRLHCFLRGLGVSEQEVEDLVGEAFCRALSRVELFDPDCGSRYLSYLFSITRNLATDHFHRSPRLEREELDEETPDEAGLMEDRVIEEICRMEQAALIREAMSSLNESDREIILLAYDREMSSREIMESLDKPSITAVTTHLYKAMKRLRAKVESLESRRSGE